MLQMTPWFPSRCYSSWHLAAQRPSFWGPPLVQPAAEAAAAQQATEQSWAAGERPLGPAPSRDQRPVLAYIRGSRDIAVAIAGNPSARERAKASLMGQVNTAGSTSAREAKLATWVEIAAAAGFEDPFEISEDLAFTIVGCLTAAGYRSAEKYAPCEAALHRIGSGDHRRHDGCMRAGSAGSQKGQGTSEAGEPPSFGQACGATEVFLASGCWRTGLAAQGRHDRLLVAP